MTPKHQKDFYEKKEKTVRFNILLAVLAAVALLSTGYMMAAQTGADQVIYTCATDGN